MYAFDNKIKTAIELGSSDIHLVAGSPIKARCLGELINLSTELLTNTDIQQWIAHHLTTEQQEKLTQHRDIDLAIDLASLGRFRVHIGHQHIGLSVALRPLNQMRYTLAELHIPPVFEKLLAEEQGLILVTGATGSGKSTSLAAMVEHINETQHKHIITLEDPIEGHYRSHNSLIQQREVGRDCQDFSLGLRAAMRQDPDVLMIGELRDLDSIRMALTAAETGHLVLATLHTASATQAIDRIIDVFPAEEKSLIVGLLAQSLTAVLYQQLLTSTDKESVKERVAVYELLIATPAVRNLIRDKKMAQLNSVIQTGQAFGMQTIAQSISHWQALGKVFL